MSLLLTSWSSQLKDVFLHVLTSQVEQQLVAGLGARAPGKIHRPVGMLAIQVAVGIHHFRLYPDAEVHAQRVHADRSPA